MAKIKDAALNVTAPTTEAVAEAPSDVNGHKSDDGRLTVRCGNGEGTGDSPKHELLDESKVDPGIDERNGAAAVLSGLHDREGVL
jgi:hypothetical protein